MENEENEKRSQIEIRQISCFQKWLLWVIPCDVRVELCVNASRSCCGHLLGSSKPVCALNTKSHQHHGELHQAGVQHQEGEVPQSPGKSSNGSKFLRWISAGWNERQTLQVIYRNHIDSDDNWNLNLLGGFHPSNFKRSVSGKREKKKLLRMDTNEGSKYSMTIKASLFTGTHLNCLSVTDSSLVLSVAIHIPSLAMGPMALQWPGLMKRPITHLIRRAQKSWRGLQVFLQWF